MSNTAGAARRSPTWPSARWTPTGWSTSALSGVATRSETAQAFGQRHPHARRAADAISHASARSDVNVQSSSPVKWLEEKDPVTHVSGQNSQSAAGG